ncbi:MAG: hypothetical protein NTX17_05810 [Candidatus Eisenbacteria bacterium]|nr:hypothetical protein [Candidatus Eisenbacteria bacterium]
MRSIFSRIAGIILAALAVLVLINVIRDREYSSILFVAIFGELSWYCLRHGSAGRSLTVRSARRIRDLVAADARARMKRERSPEGSLIRRFSRILSIPGGIAGIGIAYSAMLGSRLHVLIPGIRPTPRYLTSDEQTQLVVGLFLGLLIGNYIGALLGRALEERKNLPTTSGGRSSPPNSDMQPPASAERP